METGEGGGLGGRAVSEVSCGDQRGNAGQKVRIKAIEKTASGRQTNLTVREPIYRIISGGLSSRPARVAEKV